MSAFPFFLRMDNTGSYEQTTFCLVCSIHPARGMGYFHLLAIVNTGAGSFMEMLAR